MSSSQEQLLRQNELHQQHAQALLDLATANEAKVNQIKLEYEGMLASNAQMAQKQIEQHQEREQVYRNMAEEEFQKAQEAEAEGDDSSAAALEYVQRVQKTYNEEIAELRRTTAQYEDTVGQQSEFWCREGAASPGR